MRKWRKARAAWWGAGVLFASASVPVTAADYYWTNAVSASWTLNSAWNFGAYPGTNTAGATDSLIYTQNNANITITVNISPTLANGTFRNTNTGTLNISSGNVLAFTNTLVIGDLLSSTGRLAIGLTGRLAVTNSAGTAQMTVGGQGLGVFTVSGAAAAGANTYNLLADNVVVAESAGGTGTFAQSVTGSRLLLGTMTVGSAGVGTYTMSSTVTNNVRGALILGRDAGGLGILNMTAAGAFLAVTNNNSLVNPSRLVVGQDGAGVLNLAAGRLVVDDLIVATNAGSVGTFTWTSGSLEAARVNGVTLGAGPSSYVSVMTNLLLKTWADSSQTFGFSSNNLTVSLPGGLTLGAVAGNSKGLILSNGAALFITNSTASATLEVGASGAGTLTLLGGSSLTVNRLIVTNTAVGSATNSTFGFSTGTLTTSNLAHRLAAYVLLTTNANNGAGANSYAIGGAWKMLGGTNIIGFAGTAGTLTWGGQVTNVVAPGAVLIVSNVNNFTIGRFVGGASSRNVLEIGGAGAAAIVTNTGAMNVGTQSSGFNSVTITNGTLFSNSLRLDSSTGATSNRLIIYRHGTLFLNNGAFNVGNSANGSAAYAIIDGGVATNIGSVSLGSHFGFLTISNGGRFFSGGVVMGGNNIAANDQNYNVGGLGAASFVSNGIIGVGISTSSGQNLGNRNTLTITNATLLSGATTIGDVAVGGTANGASNNAIYVLADGLWNLQGNNLSVGVGSATRPSSNNLLVVNAGAITNAGALIVGVGATAIGNTALITNGGQVFATAARAGTAVGGADNSIRVTAGSLLEANTLSNFIGGAGNTISNVAGIYQFTTNTPAIAPNGLGNIALTDGIISFRAITNANVQGSLGGASGNGLTNILYAGNNTFRLNAATNTTLISQTYTFQTGVSSNFARLEMINGHTGYRGGNINVGATGTMLISNTVATIAGVVTNAGSLSIVHAGATFQSRVYNSGTSTMFNSVGTFHTGVINAGHWLTDPTTNVFQGFGFTNTISGAIQMAAGDVYIFTNTLAGTSANFVNISTNKSGSDLVPGKFLFSGGLGLTQIFYLAGQDQGEISATATNRALTTSSQPGFSHNFALGTLEVANYTTVRVTDAFFGLPGLGSNDFKMAGLYLENLFLGTGSLLIIDTNVQVYFKNSNNWTLANIRLVNNQSSLHVGDAFDYDNAINGLHQIVVVPEPSVLLLMISGALGLYYRGRRAGNVRACPSLPRR